MVEGRLPIQVRTYSKAVVLSSMVCRYSSADNGYERRCSIIDVSGQTWKLVSMRLAVIHRSSRHSRTANGSIPFS
ncbi:hypothetical protein BREU_2183 [Bifidobacterium reuteri DSM 23975]|uniref:Uncharacterized protein n=1 Tax=Bifidobacterium reuteri DSM 23975 TaxID=1437610 RepID=A0A087CF66_9BIFI|nr:hypothetical protein BREU_2183 [Bifidobacterium reuteri DSM 23975]